MDWFLQDKGIRHQRDRLVLISLISQLERDIKIRTNFCYRWVKFSIEDRNIFEAEHLKNTRTLSLITILLVLKKVVNVWCFPDIIHLYSRGNSCSMNFILQIFFYNFNFFYLPEIYDLGRWSACSEKSWKITIWKVWSLWGVAVDELAFAKTAEVKKFMEPFETCCDREN